MANRNRDRGHELEREIVREATEAGLDAERARGSDGRALGLQKDVDVTLEGWGLQMKRSKTIAKYVKPWSYSDDVDAVVLRQDYEDAMIVLPFTSFIELLASGDADARELRAALDDIKEITSHF